METHDDVGEILRAAALFGFSNAPDRQGQLPPAMQRLHRAVLRGFLDRDVPPSTLWLREEASTLSLDPDEAMAHLAEADLVHVSGDLVTVAYPFSGVATAHRVHPGNAQSVWAMCAIDALGVLLMTGDDGTVVSSDPDTGAVVRVERRNGQWEWDPPDTVVLLAFTEGCRTSAEGLCPQIEFHTDTECAEAHLRRSTDLTGQAVDQRTAVELADSVFGRLLFA